MHNSNQPFFYTLRQKIILFSLLAFFLVSAFSGPTRMGLSMVGLSALTYLPNAFMLLMIGVQIILEPYEKGYRELNLIAILLALFTIVISLAFLPLKQTAMGIYVLIPFLFGIVCGPIIINHVHRISKVAAYLWAAVVTGIILNSILTYPWEGFGYSLGSLEVEGSRQWYATGGTKRLAGFGRSSFDAATQAQILGLLAVLAFRRLSVKLIIWCLTAYAIFLTTSKGILGVFIVLTPIIFFKKLLPESLLRGLPLTLGLIGISFPLSTLFFTFDSQFTNPTLANITYSYYDRLNYMWPEAWRLLSEHGNMFIGRGIGGIGTAQTYFEPSLFNAADNVFLYWFVVFGWSALPIMALILLRSLRIKPQQSDENFIIFCLLISVLVYGMLTNIVENALFALVFGLLIRWLCATPKNSNVRSNVFEKYYNNPTKGVFA